MPRSTKRLRRDRAALDLLTAPSTAEPEQLLTLEQAATLTGLRLSTWRKWVATRRVPFVKLGRRAVRIKQQDLNTLIANGARLAIPAGR